MKKTQLSTSLFQQLGGTTYLSRPVYFQNNAAVSDVSRSEAVETQVIVPMSTVSESPENSMPLEHVIEDAVSPVSPEDEESAGLSSSPIQCVILGSGLNAVWEDEAKAEWQLLQNICKAFNLSESQLSYFDTDALVSEEAMFTTMEEVIELGVEWVFSMDSEHPISEQLSEGVLVVDVPSLEQMLYDPYAKQSFYQAAHSLFPIS